MRTSIIADTVRDTKQMARKACKHKLVTQLKLDTTTVPCLTNCYNLKLNLIANEVCKPYLLYAVTYAYKEEGNEPK